MSSTMCMALIPYTPPQTSMEFIRYEVERGLKNGTISLQHGATSSISSHLSFKTRMFEHIAFDNPLALKISKGSSKPIINFDVPGFLSNRLSTNHSNHSSDGSAPFSIIPESLQKLLYDLQLQFDEFEITSLKTHSTTVDEIAEVLQSEAGFTISTDKKPVLATYGCGSCVALGGYEPTNKIAFIVHFSNANEVRQFGDHIFTNISKLAKQKIEAPIQLHLRGGVKGQSEAIIEAIKIWMKQRDDFPMEIVSEDILNSEKSVGGKDISIDSKTGEVSIYDPIANSQTRGMSELNTMAAMTRAFLPRIKLVYIPNL